MKDFSQSGEQAHILRHFQGQVGTFLDIGANDGRTFSNTHALAQLGWAGVCVDASPRAFSSLVETYKDNDRIVPVNAAITDKDGPITLHEATDTLLSSLDPDQRKTWNQFEFREVIVEGISFLSLRERIPLWGFDFISIDAEGHDLDILRQMDLDELGCKMLCIEHGGRQSEIRALCPWRVIHDNGINLILAR